MSVGLRNSFWKKKGGGGGSDIDIIGISSFFSFRQLSGYSGPCIRVKRSLDSAEMDIYFYNGYLDFEAILEFTLYSGNVYVQRIYNQVNTDEFLISNLSNGAIIVSSGTLITLNGFIAPIVAGNGSYSFYSVYAATTISKTLKSSFSILKINTALTLNYYCFGSSQGLFVGGSFSGANGHGSVVGGSIIVSNNTENFDLHLQTFINSSGHNVWTDSSDHNFSGSSTADLVVTDLGRNIASSLSIGGHFIEWVFYTTDKSTQRIAIESEINSYYSIY